MSSPAGNKRMKTIVIDAGHGGHDPGCMSGGAREKDVTLKIAQKLGKLISDSMPELKIIYTRNSDRFIELWERPAIANKNGADMFVSIHCNANPKKEILGSETYVMGLHKSEGNLDVAKRENSAILLENDYKTNTNYEGFDPESPEAHILFSLYQNAYLEKSLKFATGVQKSIKKDTKLVDRGVKQAGFLVLWKTAMPSVLVETGFLTNSKDRQYLSSDSGSTKSSTIHI